MRRRALVLAGLSVIGLAGCSSMGGPQCSTIGLCTYVQWHPYNGRLKNQIIKGKFGTPTEFEGIAFYENWGAPDKPFRIIGTVTTSSNFNDYTTEKKMRDVAQEAKEQGGDAVAHVISTGHTQNVSAIVTGTAYGMVFADDLYIVMKYVDPKEIKEPPKELESMKDLVGKPAPAQQLNKATEIKEKSE